MSRSEDRERGRASPRPGSAGERRVDLRLVPLALAAWAGMWLATSGMPQALIALVAGAALVLLAARRRRSWLLGAVALMLVVSAAVGGMRADLVNGSPLRQLAQERAVAQLEVTVLTDPQRRSGRFADSVVLTGEAVAMNGRGENLLLRQQIVVRGSGAQLDGLLTARVGATLAVQGRLGVPDPGSPDAAVVTLTRPARIVAEPNAGLRLVERVRSGLRESVSGAASEPRALLPALVLGDTSGMQRELKEDFNTTGLVHLTAVSGANLSLMIAFVLGLCRWLGVRGWWLRVVGMLCVVVFIALCRTEPSVLRAAAMGVVSMAALGTHATTGKGMRHLAGAMVLLLLVDPWLARSVGFTLSVLASGGIIWWARSWGAALHWLPGPLAEAIAVPLAAQLATQPVVTAISGQISIVGLLTNALAGPLVGPATVLGFAAAGMSLILPPIAALLGWCGSWFAQGIIWIAHAGAALPGASWRWPAGTWPLGVVIAACLLLAFLMPVLLGRRWVVLLLAAAVIGAVLRTPVVPGWPGPWSIVMCDVGQGDAVVLRSGPDAGVLVDTGAEPGPVRACLDSLGITTLPLLVLTHYHDDHIGGLGGALAGRQVGAVLVSPLESPAASVAAVRGQLPVPTTVARAGEVLQVGEVTWHTLGPVRVRQPAGGAGESAEENDASIIAVATVGGIRILLTGDAEPAGQQAVVRSGAPLAADILKVAHHGSGNQDPELNRVTGARIAAVSVGEKNTYGHPSPKTVHLLQEAQMTVVRTDQQGALAFSRPGPDQPIRIAAQR